MTGAIRVALAALIGALLVPQAVWAQGAAPRHNASAKHDQAFAADMQTVHQMLVAYQSIERTVTNLPDGVRTVTESQDPRVAAYIKEHVLSMNQRLDDGEVFNMTSSAIPVIFDKADRIKTVIDETPTGIVFTQTSEDPALVPVLQAHAEEVSELAREGMAAMMRRMGMGEGGMQRGGAMPGHRHDGP